MATDSQIMERRKVLVVPESAVQSLYRQAKFYSDDRTINVVLGAIQEQGAFIDREWAEQHSTVKQIIAYAIIRKDDKVLCLKRSQKGNRSALRRRLTLMVGGHVDDLELKSTHPLEDCVVREVSEELGAVSTTTPKILGIVADPSNDVGLLHLGIIFDFQVDWESIVTDEMCDSAEFVNAGKRLTHSLRHLRSMTEKAPYFDPWSKLFLQSDLAQSMFGQFLPVDRQLKLPLIWEETTPFVASRTSSFHS
jgi:predicted NUDIX family phosphoesterase